MLKVIFILVNLLAYSNSNTCNQEKQSACSVEGGFFSEDEILNVKKTDSQTYEEIHKNIFNSKVHLYFFYAHDCSHCKKAHLFIEEAKKLYPDLKIHQYEVKKNPKNMKYFYKVCEEYFISPMGVPSIFVGSKYFVGFSDDITCKGIINEIKSLKGEDCTNNKMQIDVPMFGTINIQSISLPSFTFYIGLLDGLNPCAMWVLMFLLGIMVYAKSRKKVLFIGSIFILSSGIVYFLFMVAWFNFFTLIGYSTLITLILGIVAIVMGLINIKELFFFKKGVSLMIPEKAKPKLYKKARAVFNEKNKFFAFIGTFALAFFVNLIELGCTIGLPAIYTRILSLREVSSSSKIIYIALYNFAYIIPLAIIVAIFTFTMDHFKFNEKHGKVLKLISGLLMLSLGILLIFYPELLIFT